MNGLTDRDRRILAFERQRWNYRGSKDEAVRREFGLTGIRYEQLLNEIIDKPEALAAEPVLVKRLRRLRSERRRQRVAASR